MSEAKIVRVANLAMDEWFTLPGNTADFNETKDSGDDTVFGASFTSTQPTLTTWGVTGNALYRGFAGYRSQIRRMGTPTSFSSESMEQEDGQTYIITNQTRAPWNWEEDIDVEDNGAPVDAEDIVAIDPLFGRITFADSYTVTGPVTVSGEYFPLESFGNANAFDLTQTADTTMTTSFEIAQANGGYATMRPTLRNSDASLTAFYRDDNDFTEPLREEEQFIVEFDIAGNGDSLCRGIYRVQSESQTGDVGGDEESTVELVLSVPEGIVPFSWLFDEDSTIPGGLKLIIESWLARENIMVEYLPEGLNNPGKRGEVVITDVSISSDVEGLVEASVSLEGNGAVNDVNVS